MDIQQLISDADFDAKILLYHLLSIYVSLESKLRSGHEKKANQICIRILNEIPLQKITMTRLLSIQNKLVLELIQHYLLSAAYQDLTRTLIFHFQNPSVNFFENMLFRCMVFVDIDHVPETLQSDDDGKQFYKDRIATLNDYVLNIYKPPLSMTSIQVAVQELATYMEYSAKHNKIKPGGENNTAITEYMVQLGYLTQRLMIMQDQINKLENFTELDKYCQNYLQKIQDLK